MAIPKSASSPPSEFLVIGAGVLALSTATLLQARYPSTPITLIAAEFPTASPVSRTHSQQEDKPDSSKKASPYYASMWAGAHYRPIPFITSTHSTFATLSQDKREFHLQLARERYWALSTAERMKKLARSNTESGVQIVQAEEYLENPPVENLLLRSGDVYASAGDAFRVFGREEIDALNKKFVKHGGRTVQQRLSSTTDTIRHTQISTGTPIIIDCSGVGIEPDPKKNLIRGQTVLVRNEFPKTITRQCEDGSWSFLIPRPCGGGTVVGGTKQIGDEYGLPRAEERQSLLRNAVKYFPEFVGNVQGFRIVTDNVGMRPARKGGVRLEIEDVDVDSGNRKRQKVKVVHGYGAGGRGYELSWGIAEEVCELVSVISSQGRGREEHQRARL